MHPLQLTKEQKAVDVSELRKELDDLELRVEELEERIAPKLAANHNEAPLTID
jgi:BMFP domain-containing protein YqiC